MPLSIPSRPDLDPVIDVVVRCRNEMPHTQRTFKRLLEQEGLEPHITLIDCQSTDGSREAAEAAGVRIRDLDPEDYVAGRVLNLGMQMTESPIVAFVNADAVPLHPEAIDRLVAPLADPRVAATFGRQLSRPDADELTRCDYERSFGALESVKTRFGRFFSLAAAAIRRDVWERIAFDTHLRYSEDIDWTGRATALGYTIRYVPDAVFEHSHLYDLRGHFVRRAGEGEADAPIRRIGAPSIIRDLAKPLVGSLVRDIQAGVISPRSLAVRVSQATGYFVGRLRSNSRNAGISGIPGAAGAPGSSRNSCRTLEGGAVEDRIELDLQRIRAEVRSEVGSHLSALLLIGGYARGEGSVVERDGELAPYNDYDLLVVTPGGRTRHLRKPLADLGDRLAQQLGIEVELWPVGERELGEVPPTLMWLDVLLGGAEVIEGDPHILERVRRIGVRNVPYAEAARLLANRAVGIALTNLEARDRGHRRARHGHKAVLACGDARLLAADRYCGRVSDRAEELARLAGAPGVPQELARAYQDATGFRKRPDLWKPPRGESLEHWFECTRALVAASHLDFEALRVGAPRSPAGYAAHRAPLFDGAPDIGRFSRLYVELRTGLAGRTPLLPWTGHPRERLARAAVALAYGADDPNSRAIAAHLLGVAANAGDHAFHAGLRTAAEVGG